MGMDQQKAGALQEHIPRTPEPCAMHMQGMDLVSAEGISKREQRFDAPGRKIPSDLMNRI